MVHVVNTRARGRCLVASEHIVAGNDIIVEDPFVSVPFETGRESSIELAYRLYQKCSIGSAELSTFQQLCAPRPLEVSSMQEDMLRKLIRVKSENLEHRLEFSEIFSRINFNAFTIQDEEMMAIGVGIYTKAAMINHSCNPNCVQTFVKDRLYIRSIRDIKSGEEITITYIGKNMACFAPISLSVLYLSDQFVFFSPLSKISLQDITLRLSFFFFQQPVDVAKPTWYRQKLLREMYEFQCSCTLCQVPIGTDFWVCPNLSCKGHLRDLSAAACILQFTRRHADEGYENEKQNHSSSALLEEYCGTLSVPSLAYDSLTCSSCKNIVQKSRLSSYAADIIRPFQMYKSLPSSTPSMEKVDYLMTAYEKATSYTSIYSYCRYEILSSLCLELIGLGMFDRALPYSEDLCAITASIYPHKHPQVSIFYIQHAKLLRYLYGPMYKDFHSFVKRASECLRISHPLCHSIFTILNDITQ